MICQNQIGKLRTSTFVLALFIGFICGPVSHADPAVDASLSGQVVDDFGVSVTNINVFAFGQDGITNTFSASTDSDGYFQMGVIGGSYFLQLDTDPDLGVLSRGLVSPRVFETVSGGASVTNVTLVARRITGSITVTILNGGKPGPYGGIIAKGTISFTNGSALIDSFDSTDTNYTAGLYSTNKYNTNIIVGTYDTNLLGSIYDTNLYVPFYGSTNLIGATNFGGFTNFHYDVTLTNHFSAYFPPAIPITNIVVAADLLGSVPAYIATVQRTDTNGNAVLYVSDGTWSLHPDCAALDAMNLDCQIYRSNTVSVASTNVAITLKYYTNAPLGIGTYMVAGTNGVPYGGWLHTSGGYWPYTWAIVGGALPPGLVTNQYSSGQLTGLPTQEGSYTFTVQVTDNLQRTTTTNLTINILPPPPPRLIAPQCLRASQFQLHLATMSNRTYAIQYTTDLTHWTTVALTNSIGPDIIWVDPNALDAMRIYRAVQIP